MVSKKRKNVIIRKEEIEQGFIPPYTVVHCKGCNTEYKNVYPCFNKHGVNYTWRVAVGTTIKDEPFFRTYSFWACSKSCGQEVRDKVEGFAVLNEIDL